MCMSADAPTRNIFSAPSNENGFFGKRKKINNNKNSSLIQSPDFSKRSKLDQTIFGATTTNDTLKSMDRHKINY